MSDVDSLLHAYHIRTCIAQFVELIYDGGFTPAIEEHIKRYNGTNQTDLTVEEIEQELERRKTAALPASNR